MRPVIAIIACSGTPAAATEAARPDRRLCPAKVAGSSPARRLSTEVGSTVRASWVYDGASYLRSENGRPHLLADGQQVDPQLHDTNGATPAPGASPNPERRPQPHRDRSPARVADHAR